MNDLKRRMAALLSVKSIVTIMLTAVVSYLAMIQAIPAEVLVATYGTVIGFYFTKADKKEDGA